MSTDRAARRPKVTLLLLFVGLACGAAGWYAAGRANQRLGFSETPGTISSTRARRTAGLWHLDVEFDYSVSGQQRSGRESRLLRKQFENEKQALASVPEIAPGRSVHVFYDPERPDVAVLHRGGVGTKIFFAASALWLGLALLWFIYDRAQRKR